jgi:hypothetical protein
MDVIDQLLPGDIIREIVIWDGITPPDAAMSGNDSTQP